MANWQLTTGLQHLRAQVNARWPGRDHASDGTIGDLAHMAETSGHNPDGTAGSRPEYDDHDGKAEVRAWDMDVDLGEPGTTAQMLVEHLRDLPGLDTVIRYMIYNRRIYKAATGWAPEVYTGPSAHTEHIHFSGARSQAADENTTFDYRLWEVNMPSAQEIAEAVADRLRVGDKGIADKLGADLNGDPSGVAAGVRRQVTNAVAPEFAAIRDAIAAMPAAVMAKLADPTTPDEAVAAALGQLLGDRKDAVVALMQRT